MTLEIDSNEPAEIVSLISQVMTNIEVGPLNSEGFADYKWTTVSGPVKHIERKTWGEILTSIDHQEEQLQRHLKLDGELVFLVEGQITTHESGLAVLKPTRNGSVWVKGYQYRNRRFSSVVSWLYSISKYMEILYSPDTASTATALVAMYEYDQKTVHETFQRHIKSNTFHPNPQVVQLMGAVPGLGDKRATSLIAHFGTLWNVLSAKPEELEKVDGIGKGLSISTLRKVGRPDV